LTLKYAFIRKVYLGVPVVLSVPDVPIVAVVTDFPSVPIVPVVTDVPSVPSVPVVTDVPSVVPVVTDVPSVVPVVLNVPGVPSVVPVVPGVPVVPISLHSVITKVAQIVPLFRGVHGRVQVISIVNNLLRDDTFPRNFDWLRNLQVSQSFPYGCDQVPLGFLIDIVEFHLTGKSLYFTQFCR